MRQRLSKKWPDIHRLLRGQDSSRNPYKQAPVLGGGDQPRGVARAEDCAHVRHALPHGPTERSLSISRVRVRFVDHDD